MPCYFPLKAWRDIRGRNPKSGLWPLTFKKDRGVDGSETMVPCGQCTGCMLSRSSQWAVRCVVESMEFERNCFLTLTYDKEHLEQWCAVRDEQDRIVDISLNKKQIQLFLKKIRNRYPQKIRFFQCGEYGDRYGRPHHHMLLFNHDFRDKKYYKTTAQGNRLYTSKAADELWQNGRVIIGDVTYESAAYVARYVMKKVKGKKKEAFYEGIEPEYITMSRKPGIGKEYYKKFGRRIREQDTIIINGVAMKPPRYYDNLYQELHPEGMEIVKERRKHYAEKNKLTQEQLDVKRQIKESRIKKLKRPFERGEY